MPVAGAIAPLNGYAKAFPFQGPPPLLGCASLPKAHVASVINIIILKGCTGRRELVSLISPTRLLRSRHVMMRFGSCALDVSLT
jgi:hypothetical protein